MSNASHPSTELRKPSFEVRLRISTLQDQALIRWMDADSLYPLNKRQMILMAIRAFWNPMVAAQAGACSQALRQSVFASLEVLKSQQILLERLAGLEEEDVQSRRSLPGTDESSRSESPGRVQQVNDFDNLW
jgi:hypothetical protein